ncbi:hypothetical protein AsAng_0036870 [Aureispira anguillae]|uniref:Uncharacterized protein n=1 Tax=Aureispira anguillae TaxID=2864201 RepID=A0A915YH56_9BACT|nr:hypothetical protein AsAng_0036870 [Aureispira anguillae]
MQSTIYISSTIELTCLNKGKKALVCKQLKEGKKQIPPKCIFDN